MDAAISAITDESGNPTMNSGNNGNCVDEAPVSLGPIYAYVVPNGGTRPKIAFHLLGRL